MDSAADAIAQLRARLAQLEARADARRVRDAEMGSGPAAAAPRVHASDLRDNGASWKAAQGRNWLQEARDDLARVDMAPRVETRRIRPATAPEYASAVEPVAQESAAPVSKDGGHGTDAGTAPAPVGVEAPAGNLEGQSSVGAAPQSEQGASPAVSLARVSGSSPGRCASPKLPQARARGDWQARWARISVNATRAFFTLAEPIRGQFDGLELRSGAGPPA